MERGYTARIVNNLAALVRNVPDVLQEPILQSESRSNHARNLILLRNHVKWQSQFYIWLPTMNKAVNGRSNPAIIQG